MKYTKEAITEKLQAYPKMMEKLKLLQYELSHTAKVSADEVLEAKAFGRQGERRDSGQGQWTESGQNAWFGIILSGGNKTFESGSSLRGISGVSADPCRGGPACVLYELASAGVSGGSSALLHGKPDLAGDGTGDRIFPPDVGSPAERGNRAVDRDV